MKKTNLTFEAVKNMKQVGSIASSSIFLTKKIIKEIDFSRKINVLELGAGTGAITRRLLGQMCEQSMLYSYENNENLVCALRDIDDHRLIIKSECVSKLSQLPDGFFDVVVSSLPLANLSNDFKSMVYRDIRSKLTKSGTYIQYQYSLSDYKNIERLFKNCKVDFCLLNLPPAFIYKVEMSSKSAPEFPLFAQ